MAVSAFFTFFDHDRDRKVSHMKRYTHGPHPLSEDIEPNRPGCICNTLAKTSVSHGGNPVNISLRYPVLALVTKVVQMVTLWKQMVGED